MRATYRHVNYVTRADPAGEATWKASCVSGEEKECPADSGELGSEMAAVTWMFEHTAETGHSRYQRSFGDYALVTEAEQ